ncbi:MAG: cadherin-like beta sandwich domain-containing protein, partial [Desulfocucumaceae bacterium]
MLTLLLRLKRFFPRGLTGIACLLFAAAVWAGPAAAAAPVLTNATISADNVWVTLTFDQGVSSSAWAVQSLELQDFNVEKTGGTASFGSYDSMSHVAGSDTCTFRLNISGTPSGAEKFSFNVTDYSSVFSIGSPGTAADPNVKVYAYLHDKVVPAITSITSSATAPGVLKIGDTITFTLTPGSSEPGATVTGSYNGTSLVWTTSDGGAHYTATYAVAGGDPNQASPLQITGVTITDAAGNTSAPAAGSDVVRTIDANAPVVTGVGSGQTYYGPVTITFSDGTATLNGNPFSPGATVSAPAVYTLVATDAAGNATTVPFTISLSNNANLSTLTVSQGTLAPAFAAGTTTYTVNVAYSVESIDVTAALADAGAAMTVNSQATPSGQARTVSLNTGSNPVSIVVTAQDSSTKVYTVTVNRAAPSGNADLSALTASQGTLDPAFAAGTTTYTVNVAYSVEIIDVTAALADAGAAMTVNSQATPSGQARSVSLFSGSNPVSIVVTAQDSSTKVYSVTVNRAAP